MKGYGSFCAVKVGSIAIAVCVASSWATAEIALSEQDAAARSLVQAALESEATGSDPAKRRTLLKQALDQSPDYPAARWHDGFVSVDGEWLTVDDAARRWTADEQLAEYRSLRASHAGNPAGELGLARWCRKHQLEAEARVHWLQVLRYQPDHREALASLGVRWQEGQLLTHEEIALGKERLAEFLKSKKRWEPILSVWCRMARTSDESLRTELEDRLSQIDNATESAALDEVIQIRAEGTRDRSHYQTVSLELIDVLDTTARQWAVESLVRHAVYHPAPEVRQTAAERLLKRPLGTFVPLLLSGLETPVEVGTSVTGNPGMPVNNFHMTLYREGIVADRALEYHVLARRTERGRRAIGLGTHRRSESKWVEFQRQVENANAEILWRNERIHHVLAQVSGGPQTENPIEYWQWWLDHTERDGYGVDPYGYGVDPYGYGVDPLEKPVYEEIHAEFYKVRMISCFAKGTKVWTLTGAVPIEDITIGDRVLCQQPETGELDYRPVLDTTIRKPSPMVRIGLGTDAIEATLGHPFWVSGKGWRMAKELSPGDRIHGVHGPVLIDRIEDLDAADAWYDFAHNLVVADFGTYFVGEERLLVHDNTPEKPTAAVVPGLLPP